MRNLALVERHVSTISQHETSSDAQNQLASGISTFACDVDREVIYVASERVNNDGDGEVTIWKIEQGKSAAENSAEKLGKFEATASEHRLLVSLQYLAESSQLVLITRGGDIAVFNVDDEGCFSGGVDVQGSIEAGILAAEWSPNDSLLALVTGDDKLLLMTSTFDVLSEEPLDTSDFGEDAPINVGWGSKETQFHGSVGRAHLNQPESKDMGPDSRQLGDDTWPRISWRGDGAYFAVSALSRSMSEDGSGRKRVIRVYSHEARLQSTAEPISCLEANLSWRPDGSVIAATQNDITRSQRNAKVAKHDLIFFERNGLRHGEFSLRRELGPDREYKVKGLAWSSDSTVLAVWIEEKGGDIVQLWTTGNWHWYLKQEIRAPSNVEGSPGRFTGFTWHPEAAMSLVLTTFTVIIQHSYNWETFTSANEAGNVCVVDGVNLLLTPFRTQNVPPPMSSHQLSISSASPSETSGHTYTPVHVAVSHACDLLGAVWEDGHFAVWNLKTRIGPGKGPVMQPSLLYSGVVDGAGERWSARQILIASEPSQTAVAVLGSPPAGKDELVVCSVQASDEPFKLQLSDFHRTDLPEANGRLVPWHDGSTLVWQDPTGACYEVDPQTKSFTALCSFPQYCHWASYSTVSGRVLLVGLTTSGRLFVVSPQADSFPIATNANSFTIASGYVIYTTTAHEAYFAPLDGLMYALTSSESTLRNESNISEAEKWEKRRVERGSRIVTAVPSAMSLVLQMPRGNLETINPRPMVMAVVREDLDAGRWRKAFLACRKHRVDLTAFVEHDEAAFLEGVPAFVKGVEDVDFINLFLTSVGRSNLSSQTINTVCDAVRVELENQGLAKYINSILTAYVMKSPPEHEEGLSVLLRLREIDPSQVEDAVKYIIFLVDADRLFDTALGMYDFTLVLMIAQHAQKDPREFLPFLRELQTLPHFYQRFKVDDHLRRYEKALENLSAAGPDHRAEALAYVERYQLYDKALKIWEKTDMYKDVLNLYGEWLFDRREFHQAASVFTEAGDMRRAMVAHERALEWQELFDIAMREDLSTEELQEVAYRISDELIAKKRYADAARVLLDYADDVRQTIGTLVQGNHFSEARRVITMRKCPKLLEDVVHPSALDSRSQLGEDITEMRDQLRKQVSRLKELRVKKAEEPDAFYGTEDTNLHNVDVMTDVSMAPTAFTRYTVAPSAASKSSKKSSKTKRKMERKVGSGRKGTVDEEEYLLRSVTKLVSRFTAVQGEVSRLLPHLFQFSAEHRVEGLALQADAAAFQDELTRAIDEIWKRPEGDAETEDSWAARMQQKEKERQVDPLQRVSRPEIPGADWGLKLLK
ncbi:pol II transcription elongation factor [Coniophora puteana RWD-64-598 SS2]|uniref:Elongator complex protein 1 n=1 Tax=Coniophora puteana (strain RWD-64-598) TaxID=741705 RepID=A0A5M3MNA4_CONPW|nr:pol II transcription elongation factor [Coniophora puteana RWD-64-598 SS2]EIW80500.1 pol II transcription elongation factor [Coniophora puteana RWD-64-598 SS2]